MKMLNKMRIYFTKKGKKKIVNDQFHLLNQKIRIMVKPAVK